MKINKLQKDVAFGVDFARQIKLGVNRDDMQVVRCILGSDETNICGVLKFLGIFPERMNKAIKVGIFIELNR